MDDDFVNFQLLLDSREISIELLQAFILSYGYVNIYEFAYKIFQSNCIYTKYNYSIVSEFSYSNTSIRTTLSTLTIVKSLGFMVASVFYSIFSRNLGSLSMLKK